MASAESARAHPQATSSLERVDRRKKRLKLTRGGSEKSEGRKIGGGLKRAGGSGGSRIAATSSAR